MEERAWNNNSSKVLLKNKDTTLVLRSLKMIQHDMKDEAGVLNEFEELGCHVHFQIKILYTDEGSEIMGSFAQYCEAEGICLTVFRQNSGTKRRLGIVDRFNRMLRRLRCVLLWAHVCF